MKTPEEQYEYYIDKAEQARSAARQHYQLSTVAAEQGDYVTSLYENKIGDWMHSQAEKWQDNADQLANAMKGSTM